MPTDFRQCSPPLIDRQGRQRPLLYPCFLPAGSRPCHRAASLELTRRTAWRSQFHPSPPVVHAEGDARATVLRSGAEREPSFVQV